MADIQQYLKNCGLFRVLSAAELESLIGRSYFISSKELCLNLCGLENINDIWKNLVLHFSEELNESLRILKTNIHSKENFEFTGLKALEKLNLSGSPGLEQLKISNSPKLEILEASNCQNLKTIYLNDNVNNLRQIDLSNCSINQLVLPNRLDKLTHLNLSNNKIPQLALKKAFKLNFLFCQNNCLNSLDITSFPNLVTLKADNNNIEFIHFKNGYKQLTQMFLNNNQIEMVVLNGEYPLLDLIGISRNHLIRFDLKGNFPRLKKIILSDNRLESIVLINCVHMSHLDLSKNRLSDLRILSNVVLNTKKLYYIDISKNPLDIPEDIKQCNSPSDIFHYLKEKEKGTSSLSFVKVILLGNGCVGKTTLWKWMSNKKYIEIPVEDRTHGITIGKWKHPNEEKIIFNIWDFAGQEIYHPMNRLFLTPETIYIAIHANDESSKNNKPLSYWLDFISDLSGNCSVICFQNIFHNEKPSELREVSFNEKINFKNKGLLISYLDPIDLKNACVEEVENIQNKLLTTAKILNKNNASLPETWSKVIQALSEITSNRISTKEFKTICYEAGIDFGGELTLINHLHNTGIIFYNSKCWGNSVILNQESLLEPAYELLKGNLKAKLLWHDIADKWHYLNQDEIEYMISFMEKSQVIFVKHLNNRWWKGYRDATFIIPQLLEHKNNIDNQDYDTLYFWKLELIYEFWHQTIFDKLLVTLFKFATEGSVVFRNVFEFSYLGVQVAVINNLETKMASCYVRNGTFSEQYRVLREVREELNALKNLDQALESYINLRTSKTYSLSEWEMLFSAPNEIYKMSNKPKFFISYANDNRDVFEHFLELINKKTRSQWEVWTDKNIAIGEDWFDQIQNAIESCDFAILAVSNDFFASDFIKRHELSKFLNRLKFENRRFKFFPFLLEPIGDENNMSIEVEKTFNTQFFKSLGRDFNRPDKSNKLVAFSELLKWDGKFRSDYAFDKVFVNRLVEKINQSIKDN